MQNNINSMAHRKIPASVWVRVAKQHKIASVYIMHLKLVRAALHV